jgi:hypothetical protein
MIFYYKKEFHDDMVRFRRLVLKLYSRQKLLKLFYYEKWERFSLEVTVLNLIEELDIQIGVENGFSEFFIHHIKPEDVWLSGSKYLYRLIQPKNHTSACATLDKFFD